MSTPAATSVIRQPGRLYVAVTAISISGSTPTITGTAIGAVRRVEFRIKRTQTPIVDEGYGGEIRDHLIGPETARLHVILRQYDNDTIQRVFPNTVVGASTKRGVVYPGALDMARLGSASAITNVLFVPNDIANHMAILLRSAYVLYDEEDFKLDWTIIQEWGVPAFFQAIRDGSGRMYEVKQLSDITL